MNLRTAVNAKYAERNEKTAIMGKIRIILKVNATFPSAPFVIFATFALTAVSKMNQVCCGGLNGRQVLAA
jgi:hypothetical protein